MLACPVYAVDSQASHVDIFPEDVDGVVRDSGMTPYLISSSFARSIRITGTINYGVSSSNRVSASTAAYDFDWAGNGRYNWQDYSTGSTAYSTVYGYVAPDTYVDFYSDDVYAASPEGSIDISGKVRFWVNPADFIVNDGSDSSATNAMYPTRVAIVSSGDVISEWFSLDSNGQAELDVSLSMADPIVNLGFRFYYETYRVVNYSVSPSTYNRYLKFTIIDETSVVVNEPPEAYVPLIQEVIEQVKLVPSTIYNFFFGDDGDDAASGFKSEVDSAVSSVDQVQQEIEEGLDKPEPEQIVPDITDIVPEDDYTAFTDVFAPVMQNQMMISMMMVVLSLAFVSYVLFGKKG